MGSERWRRVLIVDHEGWRVEGEVAIAGSGRIGGGGSESMVEEAPVEAGAGWRRRRQQRE